MVSYESTKILAKFLVIIEFHKIRMKYMSWSVCLQTASEEKSELNLANKLSLANCS